MFDFFSCIFSLSLDSSSIYPITTVALLCPSPLTRLASTPLSWGVRLGSWLCQEHSGLFLPIWQEKTVVIKSPTCLDQTRTLQVLST